MTKDEYRKVINEIVYLSGCVINDIVPDEKKFKDIDLDALYKIAEKHFLTAITGLALEKVGIYDNKFVQAKAKSVRKIAAMEIYKKQLFDKLEDEKIWYAQLKGTVIKELYPTFGIRQMSDFDILFDKAYAEKVKEIMLKLGFTCDHFGKGSHDVYFRPPVCNFEMHRQLFGETSKRELYLYYKDVKRRLIKNNDSNYGYKFSPDDLYIYITAHEYKHYISGGTGLRSLLDTYVIWQKLGESMNEGYIRKEVRKLGIEAFEKTNKSLALKLFSGKPFSLSDKESKMFEYMVFSGVYGNMENHINNTVRRNGDGKKGKLLFLVKRIFLPMYIIKEYYPVFYKYKILIPFLFFYRIVKAVTVSREKTMNSLKILKNIR